MRQQLTALRNAMKQHNIDAYLIPTDDFHGSEYVGDYFKCRSYVSGFTGSAGTLLVTADWAGLWTDGRYFLQAAEQLSDSGIELMKMGETDVPSIDAYIAENMTNGKCLGFDGRCVSAKEYRKLENIVGQNGGSIVIDCDLVDEIWSDRPPLSARSIVALDLPHSGKSREEKIKYLRWEMQRRHADIFVLTALNDIAWLLNIRGDDVECTPVVLSYFVLTAADAILFINPAVVAEEIRQDLLNAGVKILPYNDVYEYMAEIPAGQTLLYDAENTNATLIGCVNKSVTLLNRTNPTILAKAIKNSTEIENERQANMLDAVPLTRFICWLKKNVGKMDMTELSLSDKLEELRRENPTYLGPSFAPIVSYAHHGAIVHYSATEESNIAVKAESLLLVDTGGQYEEGTTDTTRTVALGTLSAEQKLHYTAVLRGNLKLAAAQFKYGCTGANLDYIARQPLWDSGLDYNHGTGHGVGYRLSVHEAPNNFRYRGTSVEDSAILEPGMITSDEPGLYIAGQYGIRLENMILCAEASETEYGRFLHFETLTFVPFDIDAIEPTLMNEYERKLLNAYHAKVYEKVSPQLSEEEAQWLKNATRAI